jgi:hypothetical protein
MTSNLNQPWWNDTASDGREVEPWQLAHSLTPRQIVLLMRRACLAARAAEQRGQALSIDKFLASARLALHDDRVRITPVKRR